MQFSSWQTSGGGNSVLPPAISPSIPIPVSIPGKGVGYGFSTPALNPYGVMVFLNGQKLKYLESYTIDETTLLFTPEFLAAVSINEQDSIEIIWQ